MTAIEMCELPLISFSAATAVTSLNASINGSSTIVVSWDVPLQPNGNITHYNINFTNSGQTQMETTTYLFHILNNLQSGQVYDITVQPVTVFENVTYNGAVSNTITVASKKYNTQI